MGLEHAYSHDIGNCTILGFKRSSEVELRKLGSSGSQIVDLTDITSFRYLGRKNIVVITPMLVESKRLIPGVHVRTAETLDFDRVPDYVPGVIGPR